MHESEGCALVKGRVVKDRRSRRLGGESLHASREGIGCPNVGKRKQSSSK
jgi:hypothetical protein